MCFEYMIWALKLLVLYLDVSCGTSSGLICHFWVLLRCIINVKSNSICDPELLGSLTRFPRDISIMKHLTHAFYRFFQKPWEIDRPDISHIILLNDFILKAPPLSLCIFNIPQGLMMVPYPYQAYNLRGNSLSWDQIFDPCCDSGADRRDVEETLSPCLCDYWGG